MEPLLSDGLATKKTRVSININVKRVRKGT